LKEIASSVMSQPVASISYGNPTKEVLQHNGTHRRRRSAFRTGESLPGYSGRDCVREQSKLCEEIKQLEHNNPGLKKIVGALVKNRDLARFP